MTVDELCEAFDQEWELARFPGEDDTGTQLDDFRARMMQRVRDGLELPERWCSGLLAKAIDERFEEFGTREWRVVAQRLIEQKQMGEQ